MWKKILFFQKCLVLLINICFCFYLITYYSSQNVCYAKELTKTISIFMVHVWLCRNARSEKGLSNIPLIIVIRLRSLHNFEKEYKIHNFNKTKAETTPRDCYHLRRYQIYSDDTFILRLFKHECERLYTLEIPLEE